jgi:hypothetical protein
MNRNVLIIVLAVLLLPLVLASGAPAMRVTSSTLEPDPSQVARSTALVEFGNYVVAAGAACTELSDCACRCGRLNLPTHRCAECQTAATCIRRIVARIRQTQARLGRLDVPGPAAGAHRDLVAAAEVLADSGEYMARAVMTDPRSLVVNTRASRGARGWRPAWRPSRQIVPNARLAAYLQTHQGPVYRAERLRAAAIAAGPDPGISGTPGEQALAYLDDWRASVQQTAQRLGVTFSEAALV